MSKKMTLQEVKEKTMEILGTSNPDDVAYITQELIDSNFEDEDDFSEEVDESGLTRTVIYGHNMSYCWRDGQYHYCYQRGNNPGSSISNACGHNNKKVPWDSWDHESTGRNCGHGGTEHKAIIKFIKR
jgi:hypothetical protein